MTTTINTSYFNKTQWNALQRIASPTNLMYSQHLKGVNFTNDYTVASDGHKAIFIMGDYSENSGLTLDKNYNEIVSEKAFPNMDRILSHNFKDIYSNNHFKVNVNKFIKAHKELLEVLKGYETHNNDVYLDVLPEEKVIVRDFKKTVAIEIEATFKTWKYDECLKIHNCKSLIDIMSVFKSFKHKEVEITYNSRMTPTIINSLDGQVKALIMPIRA